MNSDRIPNPHLRAAQAVAAIVGVTGWKVIDADPDLVVSDPSLGPCAKCQQPHHRYGPDAVSTLCPDCRA
jgi:hypothetical protein